LFRISQKRKKKIDVDRCEAGGVQHSALTKTPWCSTMLHMHLLSRIRIIHPMTPLAISIQAHIARNQAALPPIRIPSLGIHHATASVRCLHELRVLLLEDGEVALGFPVPDGVGGEDEIHFLEGTLVGFGIEGPDYEDCGGVDGAEEVEGFFVELFEDCGEEEDLCVGKGGGLLLVI
jgi:hypothetical protein